MSYIFKNKFNKISKFKNNGLTNKARFKKISKNNNSLLKRGTFFKAVNVRAGIHTPKNLIYYK